MKIVSRTIECDWYEVVNHVNADSYPNDSDVLNSEPLRCRIDPIHLTKRDMAVKTDKDLLASFGAACLGESSRWKLVKVGITEEADVRFVFGDTEAVGETGYAKLHQYILFPKFNGTFSVRAHRPGNAVPDEYYFEFWNTDEFDDQGRRLVVNIEEERNGQWYAHENLNQHKDGKYYLTQYLYD